MTFVLTLPGQMTLAQGASLCDATLRFDHGEERMTQSEWVPVQTIYCPRIDSDASLLEKRELLGTADELGAPDYVVKARACSHDIECNMNDHINCRWSFKGGDDPFANAPAAAPVINTTSEIELLEEASDIYP